MPKMEEEFMEEKKEFGLEFVNIRLNHDRTLFTDKRIDNPDAAVDLLRNEMQYYDREHVIALFMDSANQVLNASICHIGAINKSVAETASILKPALLLNASNFIILHNHPSGNAEPSIDDINVTRKLEIAGKIFDIPLLDHIIVGSEGRYYSFAKEDKIGHAKLVISDDDQLGEKDNNYSVKEKSRYQNKEKQSFREQMAEAFIKSLEENPKHWIKKWSSNETGRAFNMSSGTPYSGSNAMWLKFVEIDNGYNDPRWLTFNQVIKMNEKLKNDEKIRIPKGTKMTKVEYYFMYDNLNHKSIDWVIYNSLSDKDKKEEISVEDKKTGETVVKQRYVLCSKDHYVFNAAQLENIPKFEVERTVNDIEPSLIVDSIAEGMGVQIIEKEQDRAFYTPLNDQIVLPCRYQFDSDYDYQATALHELGHATGHSKRLNRTLSTRFGSEEYAYEELVAEMTSCFMSEYVESPMSEADMENHVAYVQSWIKSIKNDKNYLFKAIKEANKAADYMIEKGGLEALKEAQNVSERHVENANDKYEMVLKVGDSYLSIFERGDKDWDYSIYDKNYKLMDGGVVKNDNTSIIDATKDIIENEESFKKAGITYDDSKEIDYPEFEDQLIRHNEDESEIKDKAGAEKRANLFEGIKTGIVSKMKKSFAKKEKEYEEEL